ncbi:hypothetical protein HYT18_04145 [Candidatus Microgenomates bacterium]|nr:hypothetical protein [Candidatus Microgenomates bacterium]
MDKQNIKNLLTRRNLFILLGAVILIEVIWAGWTLSKSSSTQPAATTAPQTAKKSLTAISLKADKTSLKVGDQVSVSVNLSSDKLTVGTDVYISFDPKLLSVETTAADKAPLIVGNIYPSYPLNTLDLAGGKIAASGITQDPGGVLANGLFGSVVFKAKAAGQTKITIDFTPSSTTDSNVTELSTAQDVLDKVENLELNILP